MWQQPQRLIITNPSPSLVPALNGTTVSVESTSNPANCLLKQKSSMENLINRRLEEPIRPWIQSAPKGLVDSVSIQERKRQEAINEVIYTECNFVRDLEYLRNCWMEPLKSRDIIPLDRRSGFVREVFWNVEEILDVNSHLRDRLIKRQIGHSIVDTIGDIFLETVPYFQPFIQYGKHQLYGKYEFEKEKSSNPAFAVFVEMVERLPESRKLELNVYLTKPIMRLVQYLLMLESVLKHTPEKNSDRSAIPKVLKMIREYLAKVNEERRRTENSFKLLQLDKALVFRPGVQVELGLRNEQRELLHHSLLECHEGTSNTIGRLHVFLLDHVLLTVQTKMVKKHEQLEVFKQPIPLELLVVSILDEDSRQQTKSRKWFFRRSHDRRASNGAPPPPVTPTKSGYQLRVWYLGRNGYTLTLGAPTIAERDKWLEKIMARQEAIGDRSGIFNTHILNTGVFLDKTKVNCAVSYDQGRRVAYGTDIGVYFQLFSNDRIGNPEKRLDLGDVQQVDILEDCPLLIVLSGRQMLAFPLEAIEKEVQNPTKIMQKITCNTSFFKIGHCLGRAFVCAIKVESSGSTITMLEPIEWPIHGRNQPTFTNLLQEDNDTLKEFYIPYQAHSINFLKTKLCIACTTGFEIVDLGSLDTQTLLNPADISLDFMQHFGDLRPLDMYQIGQGFLLCDCKLAFYVSKGGWWSKKNVVIRWEGTPNAFALHYPYIMAFESTFVEVRHVEDGALVQVIRRNDIRLLFADSELSIKTPTNSARPVTHSSNEIIMASDDKVMAVRLVPPLPHTSNDSVISQS